MNFKVLYLKENESPQREYLLDIQHLDLITLAGRGIRKAWA